MEDNRSLASLLTNHMVVTIGLTRRQSNVTNHMVVTTQLLAETVLVSWMNTVSSFASG